MRWYVGLAPLCVLAGWWWLSGAKVGQNTTAASPTSRASSLPWGRAKPPAQRRAALVGRVFDPDGGPLPGALVVVVKTPMAEGAFADLEPLAVLRSDGEGRFRIEQLGLSATVMVSATARGWAATATAATLSPAHEASIELRLARGGGTFYGRVTDGPDAPISASVRVLGGNDAVYQVECDRDGRYELTVPAAAWTLAARADGYDPWSPDDDFLLGERDRIRVDIEMAPETSIRVRVRGADGKPVIGANVFAGDERLQRVGITDERGEYVVRHPDASMAFAASFGGLCWAGRSERPAVGESVVDLETETSRNVRVRVEDEVRRPMAGAVLSVNDSAQFTAGPDGRMEIIGLCPQPQDLVVITNGRRQQVRLRQADSDDLDGIVVLRREYQFRLSVLDERGVPLVGARVWIPGTGSAQTNSRGQLAFTASAWASRGVRVDHPKTGRTETTYVDNALSETAVNELEVHFDALTTVGHIRYRDGSPAAHIAVHVDHNVTYSGADGSFVLIDRAFEVDAFVVEKDDTTAVIERADQLITGRVVDPDGQPVWGATVKATPEAELVEYGQMKSVRTGADGRFVITGLASGKYGLVARHSDFDEVTLIEQSAGSTVTMKFEESATEEPLVD